MHTRAATVLVLLVGCGGGVGVGDPDAGVPGVDAHGALDAHEELDARAPVADVGQPDALAAEDAFAETTDAPAALDAVVTIDAGRVPDAGPVACTPITGTGVVATIGTPVSFELVELEASARFAVLLDIDTGVAFQTTRPDGTDIVGRSPLDTGGTGAWGLASVNVPGTDDLIVARWRDDLARIDRHVVPGGMADTRTAMLLTGSLVDRGVGCALGADALVVQDEQGLGDPTVVRRVPRTGAATVVFRDTERRSVDLAARPAGGALLAMSGGVGAPESCVIVPIDASGSAGAPVPLPVGSACERVAITARPDGAAVLAFVHGTPSRVAYQVLDSALATVGPVVELGPALPGRVSVTSGAASTFRISWQDAAGLSSRSFEADGALRSAHCITGVDGVYAEHRAAHVGTTTGLAFVTRRAVSLASLPD